MGLAQQTKAVAFVVAVVVVVMVDMVDDEVVVLLPRRREVGGLREQCEQSHTT